MSPEKDLTAVLQEAASLAADLAVEIGEPVPGVLTKLKTDSESIIDTTSLEDASDLDAQLANLQELVDDAAAGVETPDEATNSVPATANETASPPETPSAKESGSVATEPATDSTNNVSIGVVGNMPKQPPLEPPPPPTPEAKEPAEPVEVVSPGQRVRGLVSSVGLTVGDKCVRFLELFDEPFQFVGSRPRTVIGLFALATVGASAIVAILAMLL